MLPEDKEFEIAFKTASKKAKIYKSLPKQEFNQKLSAFLARRGFSWEIIKKVLDKLKFKC
jgi:SOS response regulatory protein OraA/RecX